MEFSVSKGKKENINVLMVDNIVIRNRKLYLYAKFDEALCDKNKLKIRLNEKLYSPSFYELKTNYDELSFDSKYIKKYIGIKYTIDLNNPFKFGFVYADNDIYLSPSFSNQCVLTNLLSGSYYVYDKMMLTFTNGEFACQHKSFPLIIKREFKNMFGLIKEKKIKVFGLRYIVLLSKLIPKKNVWLLSDRINKADDNAEHLFRYILKNKHDINPYFVISKESSDYARLKKVGKVVDPTSLRYKFLFHHAKFIVSSHAEGYITNIYGKKNQYYRDLFKYRFVFLQHGITQNDLSSWINPNTRNIDMIVAAAKPEADSFENYGYPDGVVQLTGFSRYDGLIKKQDKYKPVNSILISFTWRSSLTSKIDSATGKRIYNEKFKESNYFKWVSSVLSNKKLTGYLKKLDYKIRFVPHPNLIVQIDDFSCESEQVEIVKDDVNYQKEFCENKILVTDSSSIFFDFAYLKKPVVYYQPDNKELYESQVYDRGYFDYNKYGFGPVVEDEDKLVNYLITLMKNDAVIDKKYEKRIDSFFEFKDQENCERIFNCIVNIDKK